MFEVKKEFQPFQETNEDMQPKPIYQSQAPPSGPFPIMPGEQRRWVGGSLLSAIKAMLISPTKSTPELLEDPNAPSPFPLVFLMAIITGIFTYLDTIKVEYNEVEVDPLLAGRYNAEVIKDTALQTAFVAFILTFIFWWVGSWLLGYLIKGGLPPNSYVKYNATQAMRRLNSYRYAPKIITVTIQILLLSREEDRVANVSEGQEILGIPQPQIEFIQDYSAFYIAMVSILTLIGAIIASIMLYKGIKHGLNHQGNAPLIIAILLVIGPFLLIQ